MFGIGTIAYVSESRSRTEKLKIFHVLVNATILISLQHTTQKSMQITARDPRMQDPFL
jgi:uncharacterized membrane protein